MLNEHKSSADGVRRLETVPLLRPLLHLELVDRLRDMIVDGRLGAGERIVERELCGHFGISRTPLREALLMLAAEGLIELVPRRGTRVAEVRPAQVRNLLELVGGLEAFAGELACQRASDAEIAAIRRQHETMLQLHGTGEMLAYFKLNEAIHDAIVAAAHNDELTGQHRLARNRILHALYLPNIKPERWLRAIEEHEAFTRALERRDAAAVAHHLRLHKERTWTALEDVVGRMDASGTRARKAVS